MIVSTEVVILHSRKYGDSSKIVSAYSRDEGLVSLIAKGARKSKSKFGGALEPLCCSSVSYYKKPNRGLQTLSRAELAIPMNRLTEDVDHISAGLLILESVSRTQEEGDINIELYGRLVQSLKELNLLPEEPFVVFILFQVFLTVQLGINVDFTNDIVDGRTCWFSFENGCLANGENSYSSMYRFDKEIYSILNEIVLTGYYHDRLNDSQKKRIIDFFEKYYSFHLDRSFRFRSFNLF